MNRLRFFGLVSLLGLAACVTPGTASEPETASREVRLAGTARLANLSVTPLRVIEDSRCAIGVQCIQAGTVRIEARVRAAGHEQVRVLGLGVPVDLGSGHASLLRVCPYPVHGSPVRPGDYRFTLLLTTAGSPPLIDIPGCPPS